MNEDAMKKVYFAHKKIIKRWESQMGETPVVFENGKKIRNTEPDESMVHDVEATIVDNTAEAPAETKEVDINNVDDIIANFVKTNQDAVNSILNGM